MPDPEAAKEQLKLLWLSCGSKDGLIHISQGLESYLREKGVPHEWNDANPNGIPAFSLEVIGQSCIE